VREYFTILLFYLEFSEFHLQRKAHSKVERRGTLRGLVAESPTRSFYGGTRPKKAHLLNKISDKSFILNEENWSKSIIFASIIRFILIFCSKYQDVYAIIV
jgi:hypothetical protein